MAATKLLGAALALLAAPALAQAKMEPVPERAAGEGEGPYPALLIAGAAMIDGTGAPPVGPVDILVEGNRIAAIQTGVPPPPCASAPRG